MSHKVFAYFFRTCPRCGGWGELSADRFGITVGCPDCNGRGRVRVPVYSKRQRRPAIGSEAQR